jgi:hypothetical protein
MRNLKFLTQKSNFTFLCLKYIKLPISNFYKIPKRFIYNKKEDIEEFGINLLFIFKII